MLEKYLLQNDLKVFKNTRKTYYVPNDIKSNKFLDEKQAYVLELRYYNFKKGKYAFLIFFFFFIQMKLKCSDHFNDPHDLYSVFLVLFSLCLISVYREKLICFIKIVYLIY